MTAQGSRKLRFHTSRTQLYKSTQPPKAHSIANVGGSSSRGGTAAANDLGGGQQADSSAGLGGKTIELMGDLYDLLALAYQVPATRRGTRLLGWGLYGLQYMVCTSYMFG